jgi:hypothetical protein
MRNASQTTSLTPDQMRRFAARASALDEELQREAARLSALLDRFDASCVEPGFRLPPLTPLAGELRRAAREAAELSHWVAAIAERVQEADRTATTPPAAAPASQPSTAVAAPASRDVILQTAPDGDPAVLATTRYEASRQFEVSMLSGRMIRTVGEHIREYGCLLTSYTMLLRDAGARISVADLYKANYSIMTGRSFDADAQQGAVTLFDLNSTPAVIARVANGAFQSAGGALGANPAEDLRSVLERVGTVIIRTERAGSEHWIVVDGANADGSFNVRDPMRGQQSGVFLGNSTDVQYRLAPQTAFLYLQPNT